MISQEPTKPTSRESRFAFHWSYLVLPLSLFALSLIFVAYFYPRLPVELAYSFKGGLAERHLGREAIILWCLAPQLFLILFAGVITLGMAKLSTRFGQPASARFEPASVLRLMGNMVALPQALLTFALLDIFSYNAYQRHLMPLWVFVLVLMSVGSIILGVFFSRALRRFWGARG